MADLSKRFDFIIAGAGASGLSLAWHLINNGLGDKSLLVVDQTLKPQNDKTWCFWERDTPAFQHLVHKKWSQSDIFVNGDHFREQLQHYLYYSIRSRDYRSTIINELKSHPQVSLLEAPVNELTGDDNEARLTCPEGTFRADYIFQSCFKPGLKREPKFPLIQHFLGWEVSTPSGVFDEDSFILMDFDETYRSGIGFMYVLPWSANSGLLEYTIFSKEPEEPSVYENKLELYLHNRYGLQPINYSIERVEYGKIPMNDSVPQPWYAPHVLNLGTNAGLTKPSTGYTFRRIQQHSRAIAESLVRQGAPAPAPRSERRFRNYDLWLLQIIHDHPDDARNVFAELFKNNSLDEVFRFLGEESNFQQDLNIMASVPWWPFLRAIWRTKGSIFRF